MSHLRYRDYTGSAELSAEDGVFHGRVLFIRDLVTYESATARGLMKAFRSAVDDYLEDCASAGRAPDTPFKGSFNVRVGPELHRRLAERAQAEGRSLNELVATALEGAVGQRRR